MLTNEKLLGIGGLQRKALLAGLIGCVVALLGGLLLGERGDKIFESFLIAFLLCFGLGAGSMACMVLHHLCGGGWSFLIQRICEAGSRTLWFFFVLGILILLGGLYSGSLYEWSDLAFRQAHHIVENKERFLNPSTFTVCFLVYFAIWFAIATLYNRWSKQLDATGNHSYLAAMKVCAGPCLILYVLSMTFAATHWAMSLEPEWFSTIYGAWMIAGYNLTVIAFAILMLTYLKDEPGIKERIQTKHYHHLGNFLLGFTIFWTYISFSQFLIIWNGNLPEEIGFYIHRTDGGLTTILLILMIFNWFVPMMVLLMRRQKTDLRKLRRIAIYTLVMRFFDMYWNIAPSFPDHHGKIVPSTLILSAAATIGIGGLWFYIYLNELKKRPLTPQQDPRGELMFYEEEHSHA
ncbi:MAG: hypothetical protein HYV27_13580 [Candidatus Hydrogenedentes bacterium]|nr:hypothetical protein [Candidatus Hydrogenedentota bacterium]